METYKINAVLLGVVRREDRDMILIRIGDEVVECTPSYAAMVASHIDGLVSLFDDPGDSPVPGEGSVPPITQAQAH